MQVLIAEDDMVSRSMLEAMLKKWDYDVTVARDGDEAWQALQLEGAPQLAIIDWMMPGLDGIEICRLLKEKSSKDRQVYVLMLTARAEKEDIVLGLEAGANDYIIKPFNQHELRARLGVARRVIELQTALARRVRELEEALSQIKTLHGIVTICMHCKHICNDESSWERLESYIEQHSDVEFSHGVCPDCMQQFYPDISSQSSVNTDTIPDGSGADNP